MMEFRRMSDVTRGSLDGCRLDCPNEFPFHKRSFVEIFWGPVSKRKIARQRPALTVIHSDSQSRCELARFSMIR